MTARKRKKKSWAGFPLVVGVIGLVALLLAYLFRKDLISPVMAGASAMLGLAFLWAFGSRDVWWAVIPGVGLLILGLICVANCLLLSSIVWLSILLLGLGAYLIAVIPNDKVWINVFYVLGLILTLIAILLSPIVQIWQIILMIAFVLLFALTLWLDREDLGRFWS
jgi:hypothetical protein